jgi:hypothetical protein
MNGPRSQTLAANPNIGFGTIASRLCGGAQFWPRFLEELSLPTRYFAWTGKLSGINIVSVFHAKPA